MSKAISVRLSSEIGDLSRTFYHTLSFVFRLPDSRTLRLPDSHHIRRSSRNSDAGSTLVTSRKSRARVQAT
jgi:hypothetical protein